MGDYCKVIVIDDEFITRQGIRYMLSWEEEGFQIIGEASNGQEGLELIEQLKPDIVLSDIVMPVLDGIDFSVILQEKYPDVQLIILSSYDNFEYVRTTLLNGACDYVLKPTLSPQILLDALKKAARRIPGFQMRRHGDTPMEKQLERYFAGYQESLDEKLYKEMFPYMRYRVLAADLKRACAGNQVQMLQVQEQFEKTLKENGVESFCSFWAEQEIYCLLINYQKKQEEELLEEVRIASKRAVRVAEKLLFVISRAFSELEECKSRYEKDILSCLGKKFYFHEESLVLGEEASEAGGVERYAYEEYIEYLKSGEFRPAIHMLASYIRYLIDCRHDEYLMKNLLKNLLYNCLMEMSKRGMESERLKLEYFRSIDRADSVEEFSHCTEEIFEQLEEMTGGLYGEEDGRITRMKEYISQHYSERLDLMEVAQVFSFNYHYISSYFNQYIPEGFSGYLNKVRIEKACGFLADSKIPISDISEMVGYSDHGYFCRVFKKKMGVTPSRYRSDRRLAERVDKDEKKR